MISIWHPKVLVFGQISLLNQVMSDLAATVILRRLPQQRAMGLGYVSDLKRTCWLSWWSFHLDLEVDVDRARVVGND